MKYIMIISLYCTRSILLMLFSIIMNIILCNWVYIIFNYQMGNSESRELSVDQLQQLRRPNISDNEI